MEVIATFGRRLVVALGVGLTFALVTTVGVVRAGGPAWAKIAECLTAVAVAVAGGFASATFGSNRRRFFIAMALVVFAEVVAANILINTACFLGGCGE
jgi:hypothetical protein